MIPAEISQKRYQWAAWKMRKRLVQFASKFEADLFSMQKREVEKKRRVSLGFDCRKMKEEERVQRGLDL